MRSLIYKDLLLQKKMLLFAFGYGIVLLVAFNNPIFRDVVYNMGIVVVSYMMLVTAISFDEKTNTNIIFISLPINRKKLILEKYILVFVTVFIGLGIMGLLGALIKISGIINIARFVSINDLLFSLASVLFLNSVYLPLYLKLGSKYSRVINIIFFLVLFFLPSWVMEFLVHRVDKAGLLAHPFFEVLVNTPTWLVGSILLAITLIFTLLSYLISVRIYMKKEF